MFVFFFICSRNRLAIAVPLVSQKLSLRSGMQGDLLAIKDAGAYCYAMGGTYNLRPMPAEVVVENGEFRLSRKRLSPEDLVALITGESINQPQNTFGVHPRPDAA